MSITVKNESVNAVIGSSENVAVVPANDQSALGTVKPSHAEWLEECKRVAVEAQHVAYHATLAASAEIGARKGKSQAKKYIEAALRDAAPVEILQFLDRLAAQKKAAKAK